MIESIAMFLRRGVRRLSLLFRKDRSERDMDEEMRFHIEMEARDLVRQGLPPGSADRRARVAFGGTERYKEEARDALGTRLVEDLLQDLRYALRQFAASPSFTVATVLTLGLGIGASTVMYAFANLTSVPFDDVDRLVFIRQYGSGCSGCRDVAAGNALHLARQSRSLESVAFMSQGASDVVLRSDGRSELVRSANATHGFFRTVGVRPLIGQTFLVSDTLDGQSPVAVISEGLWRARFGGDTSLIGRGVLLDGIHHVVRGVLPAGYEYPDRTDVWTLRRLTTTEVNEHSASFSAHTIGRLQEGVTVEEADAEARDIGTRLAAAFPQFRDWTLGVRPLAAYSGYSDDRTKTIFFVAVGLVLLVSCTNLAGVLLARLTRRRRELAVRVTMGANGSRVARQLLTETILICLVASAAGVVVAHAGLSAVLSALPASAAPPGWTRVGLDWGAFLFAMTLGVTAALAIGLWPSLRFARPDLQVDLRDGARSTSRRGSTGGERVRRTLVVLELALALVLVAAASLLVRSMANIASAPVGIASDHVLTMRLQVPLEVNGKRVVVPGYFDRVAGEVARIPGVSSAGAVAFLPLSRGGWSSTMFQIEGGPPLEGSGGTRTQVVTPGYFAALKIPLLRGAYFTDADTDASHRVAMINESLARRHFPDVDPVGRVLRLHDGTLLTVKGVVGDVKQQGAVSRAGHEIITPAATTSRRTMYLVARTHHDPLDLAAQVMDAVTRFDANLAISRVQTMEKVAHEYLAPYRVMLMLMGGFAAIAMVVAVMGLYAVVSYAAASRTKEFGVRLALGASGAQLLLLVLRQALTLTGLGVIVGVAGALAATRVMGSMLYGVRPGDPRTVALAGVAICGVALLAALHPARRAMRVDPVRSLGAD